MLNEEAMPGILKALSFLCCIYSYMKLLSSLASKHTQISLLNKRLHISLNEKYAWFSTWITVTMNGFC